MPLKTCTFCGKEFNAKHGARQLCSYECQIERSRQRSRDINRIGKTMQTACKRCGVPMASFQSKYCSANCRHRSHWEKKRKPCLQCGGPSNSTSGKCRSCVSLERKPFRECKECRKTFRPKNNVCVKFCSRDCSFANLKANATGGKRKPKPPKAAICRMCGKGFTTGNCSMCCSKQCQKRWASASSTYKRLTPIRDTCLHCKGPMNKTRYIRLYCSRQCTKRAANKIKRTTDRIRGRIDQQRRRESQRGQERFHPNEIFDRDNWRCHICGKRVAKGKAVPDFKAPVMDHIVPICRGGEHSRQNVRCAHFICNSKRRDVEPAQQLLFG